MRARFPWIPLLVALLLLPQPGCNGRKAGEDLPGPQEPGVGALVISPADPVLLVDGKSGATQGFRVTRKGEDVSAQVSLWLDDARLGSFQGATFSANPGAAGKTVVRTKLGEDMGQTTLTLRVSAVVIAPGAPADAPRRFEGGNDSGRAPLLAYPPAGALIPPNLLDLEIQWQPRSADLFEVSLVGDGIDLRVYTLCTPIDKAQPQAGCALIPDELSWKLLSQSARGSTVKLKVRGTALAGGGVGTSEVQDLSFGDDDIRGGIYYWAATGNGIFRYDFGRRGQKAEPYYTPGAQAGLVTCVGCHALSRNGKRIAAGVNIPGPAQMRALDVATRAKLFEVGTGILNGSNYQTFTADGSKLVTTEGGGLTLRDGTSGLLIGKVAAIENANMPDFSPDSTRIVFARGAPTCQLGLCQTLSANNAGIYTVAFNGDSFGQPAAIVPPAAGENNYYPSFSPDGKFVVYNRAGGDSYDAKDARVMIVAADGGTPIDLASLNQDIGNSWPKWAPFVQRFKGQTVFWLTFSSRRAYGLRRPSAAQLWMAPVTQAKLAQGADPGFPPFWLPFQNIATGNHIAQWVEKVERAPCMKKEDCGPTETCENGGCVVIVN